MILGTADNLSSSEQDYKPTPVMYGEREPTQPNAEQWRVRLETAGLLRRRRNRLFGRVWSALAWFWVVVLLASTTGLGVLQMLGPGPSVPADPPGMKPSSVTRQETDTAGAAVLIPSSAMPQSSANPRNAETPPIEVPPEVTRQSVTSSPPASGPRLVIDPVGTAPPITAKTIPASRPPKPAAYKPALDPTAPALEHKSVVLHYLAGSPTAQATAERLIARLGIRAELHSEPTVPSSAIIGYVSAADHSAARYAGNLLGDIGYDWHIENVPNRAGLARQSAIEIWLPSR